MKKLIASILFTAFATASAHADATRAPSELEMAARWLVQINEGQLFPAPDSLRRDDNGVTRCHELVAYARSQGATAFQSRYFEDLGGTQQGEDTRWTIPAARGEELCREAAYYAEVVLKELPAFKEILVWTSFGALTASQNEPAYFKQYEALPDQCDAAVDRMLAAKIPPTTPFPFGTGIKTVADLKPNLCNVARENFKKYPAWWKQEQTASRAPYEKAGLKGDKLELVMTYDGNIYLPGGSSTDNLKKLVASSTLFTWMVSDPDGAGYVVHTVRKHVFKGNKLVKTAEKNVRLPKGQEPSGKAFR